MKVVITGTGGRLGAAVTRHLRVHHRAVAYDRKAMDLREPRAIADHLEGLAFDVLINCAALTSLDYCEHHPGEAQEVNAAAPAQMAQICRQRGARMIHLSTNYVYDGTRPGLRSETDPARPLSVYARTKLDGELAVLAASPLHLVARTAWIFGPDRPGFVDQIIERALKSHDCSAIEDVWSSASYSLDMAEQIERLALHPDASGIYNLSNEGSCSWRELGQAALDGVTALGCKLRCPALTGQNLASMGSFLAPRPVHTGLDVSRLTSTTGLRPRPWREALRSYLGRYYLP